MHHPDDASALPLSCKTRLSRGNRRHVDQFKSSLTNVPSLLPSFEPLFLRGAAWPLAACSTQTDMIFALQRRIKRVWRVKLVKRLGVRGRVAERDDHCFEELDGMHGITEVFTNIVANHAKIQFYFKCVRDVRLEI